MARVTVKKEQLVNYSVQIDDRDADEYYKLWVHCRPSNPFWFTKYAYFSTLWGAMRCARRIEQFLKNNSEYDLLKDTDGTIYSKDIE